MSDALFAPLRTSDEIAEAGHAGGRAFVNVERVESL